MFEKCLNEKYEMNNKKLASNKILIATLDVLGVTQLMRETSNESLEAIAAKIKDAFEQAKTCVKNRINGLMDRTSTPQKLKEIIIDHVFNATVHFHDFSDTIVMSCDTNKINFDAIKEKLIPTDTWDITKRSLTDAAVRLFGIQVTHSVNELFIAGFPVRGCVDVGTVYMADGLVVGKAYVDALKLSETLDFSGVVVTDAALDFCKEHENGDIIGTTFTIADLWVPTTGKENFHRYKCLNWLDVSSEVSNCKPFTDDNDWQQLLYEKFAANGKSMTASALRKLANTENTIRAFILQNKASHENQRAKK